MAASATLPPDAATVYSVSELSFRVLRVDPLSRLFGLIFCLITVIGVIYALQVRRWTEHAATLVYAAGSLGVVFAGDWLTAFIFWEVMGIASLFVIWHGDTQRSAAAGFRYLFVHIAGGAGHRCACGGHTWDTQINCVRVRCDTTVRRMPDT